MRPAQWANNRGHPDTRASLLAAYLSLPGSSGNYASTPDSVAASVTGDIDIRVKAALNDWTPAGTTTFVSKWPESSGPATVDSYVFYIETTGILTFLWTTDGTNANDVSAACTVATGLANAALKWVRVTLDVDNGAAGNDVKFYTSDDGDSWVQLGATVTTAGVTSIYNNLTPLQIGMLFQNGTTWPLAGKVYRAQVYNGIGGTLAVDFNPALSLRRQTSLRGSTGELWTINQSGATPAILTL